MQTLPGGQDPVIYVAAHGYVSVPYDYAYFRVVKRGIGTTAPEAKRDVDRNLMTLVNWLKDQQSRNVIEDLRTTYAVHPRHKYVNDNVEDDGYECHFIATFSTTRMDEVNNLMDQLTEIEGNIRVDAPQLKVKQTEEPTKGALRLAWEQVQRQFAFQCELLGFSADEFEVAWWSAEEDGRELDTMRAGAAAGALYEPPQRINFDNATFAAYLKVGYVRTA